MSVSQNPEIGMYVSATDPESGLVESGVRNPGYAPVLGVSLSATIGWRKGRFTIRCVALTQDDHRIHSDPIPYSFKFYWFKIFIKSLKKLRHVREISNLDPLL